MASIIRRATHGFGETRHVTFLMFDDKASGLDVSCAWHGSCMRPAQADVASALSRSSSTESAKFRRACEHVTEVTVRHEGKPSEFGRVRLDIGVIPQCQVVEKGQWHFPLAVSLVGKLSLFSKTRSQ